MENGVAELFGCAQSRSEVELAVSTPELLNPIFVTLGAPWEDEPLHTIYEASTTGISLCAVLRLALRQFEHGCQDGFRPFRRRA